MRKSIILLAALILLCGCESNSENPEIHELTEALKQSVNDAARAIEGLSDRHDLSGAASEEVEKLFIFDYEVIELKRSLDSETLEAKLDELGKERWECFHVEPENDLYRLFCRRRPKSYLRYMKLM